MDEAHRSHQRDPRAGRPDQPQQVRDPRSAAPLSASAPSPPPPGAGFPFVQIEVPRLLGPPDGRYVLREDGADEVTHVAVLATLGAPRRPRRLSRSRPRAITPEPGPAAVSTGRATIIAVRRPFAQAAEAQAWLQAAGEAELAEGLTTLNRVLHAFRLVAADPAVTAIVREHLIAARLGHGSGEQVADGRFTEARELPEPAAPRGRRRTLPPQARLAAMLGGRERPLACAELVLRARLDLDAGRPREAALQTLIALDTALAELAADPGAAGLAERLAALRGDRETVAAAAQAALSAIPGPDAQQEVEATVARLEAALRARVLED